MLTPEDIPKIQKVFPDETVFICIHCYILFSLEPADPKIKCDHGSEWNWSVAVLGHLIASLCCLCLSPTVKSGEIPICDNCEELNETLDRRWGRRIRPDRLNHGDAWSGKILWTDYMKSEGRQASEEMRVRLWRKTNVQERLANIPKWRKLKAIGVTAWQERFPIQPNESEKSFLEYAGLNRFSSLDEAFANTKELTADEFFGTEL